MGYMLDSHYKSLDNIEQYKVSVEAYYNISPWQAFGVCSCILAVMKYTDKSCHIN